MMESGKAAEQRQKGWFEWLISVAPSGAFQDSDAEPTAYAVGYLLPQLRSSRRRYDCNKVSCAPSKTFLYPASDSLDWMLGTKFLRRSMVELRPIIIHYADMKLLDRITVEPGKCGGRPCIRGLRIRVTDILGMLAEDVSHEEILRDFPYLEPDDIRAALAYAARQSDHAVLQSA